MGWHFTTIDKRLGSGDDRLVVAGETLTVDCDPVLWKSGLHAGYTVMGALQYARGSYLWRVELGGVIVRGQNEMVATERTALWGFDASEALRLFARRCALDVIDLWSAPDVAVRYLNTGDEAIRFAALVATHAMSHSTAAKHAARDTAWAAARDAGYAAADARSAWIAANNARSAKRAAGRPMGESAQRRRLASLVSVARRAA
jgi:hypothetical protein